MLVTCQSHASHMLVTPGNTKHQLPLEEIAEEQPNGVLPNPPQHQSQDDNEGVRLFKGERKQQPWSLGLFAWQPHLTLTSHSQPYHFTPHPHTSLTQPNHLTPHLHTSLSQPNHLTPHSHTSLSQPNHTSHLCKQPQLEDQTGYRHDDTHNGKQEAIIIHLDEPISRPVQTWVERQYITTGATINTIYGKTFECFTFTIFQVYMKSITFFHLTSQYIHNSLWSTCMVVGFRFTCVQWHYWSVRTSLSSQPLPDPSGPLSSKRVELNILPIRRYQPTQVNWQMVR